MNTNKVLSIECLMMCLFLMQTRGHNLNSYCLQTHLPKTLFRSLSVTESILCSLYCFRVPLSPSSSLFIDNVSPKCEYKPCLCVCYTGPLGVNDLLLHFLFSFLVFLLYVFDTRGHPCGTLRVSTSSRTTVSKHTPLCHCCSQPPPPICL